MPCKPRIAGVAGLKKRGATEIIARRIDRPSGRERRDDVRRAVAQCMIAHVDQNAVVGPERVAGFELGRAVAAYDLPVGAATQHLAAHLRSGKIATGDRDDPPPTLAHIAEIERRIDGDMGREDEFECWN